MEELLGVGGLRVRPEGDFDFWLPAYMLLTFLLARSVVGMRLRAAAVVAFAGGTLWASSAQAVGTLPAAAIAILVAILAGGIRRRRGWPQIPPH